MLSVLIHVGALLALLLFVSLPRPTPLEPFIVIDVGSPAFSEEQTDAATVDAPAPEAPAPQVEAERVGTPSERPAPAPPPEPEQVEAPAVPEPEAAPPEPEAPDVAEAEQPQPTPPAPTTPPPVPAAESLPGAPAAAVPEIEEEILAPRPLAESLPIPRPTTEARVADAVTIAPEPRSEVTEAQEVPLPAVSASVAPERPVPSPSVTASVASPESVPTPSVRAEVATASPIPSPAVTASVAEARSVPRPTVTAEVRPQETTAEASPELAESLPEETEASSDRATGDGAAELDEVPPGVATPPSNRVVDAPTGGNAPRAGQPTPPEEGEGLGAAAGPTGEEGTGVPARPEPYIAFKRPPVSVLIDNAIGYPQSGLVEAAVIVEMPVEGGLTRLMPIYDTNDPGTVGPVRSARDYFVKVAQSYDSVLVHDGGSPAALQVIAESSGPTLNAYSRGELFARAAERSAPYNLYSEGTSLRAAVNRLRTGDVQEVQGTIFRPAESAREVTEVSVRYGGTYQTGFAFQEALGTYRWVRNGTPAVDASGEQVRVDAVLVAAIEARPFPDDPAGRLYIPLEGGGAATLYVRGRAVDGTWFMEDGIRFRDGDGNTVDLRAFKVWMSFAPDYGSREER